MRRLLTFPCEGAILGATLEAAGGATGLLLVTGGSQTRVGSHRMYERLSNELSKNDISCFRFDRRGVGDSEGEDPDFRGSAPDMVAAAAAFRREQPGLERLVGFGLCDGATAIALFGGQAGLDGLILVNPWLVEAEANEPPAAAISAHYRQRLTSWEGWKKILSGAVDYRKLLRGIVKVFRREDSSVAGAVATAMARDRLPSTLILARGDATAIAAEAQVAAERFGGLIARVETIETDSHTFARPGDESALVAAVLRAVSALPAQAS